MRGLSLALGQSILRALHSRGSQRQVTEAPLKAHTLGPTDEAIQLSLTKCCRGHPTGRRKLTTYIWILLHHLWPKYQLTSAHDHLYLRLC